MLVTARLDILGLFTVHVLFENEAGAAGILLSNANTVVSLAVLTLTLGNDVIAVTDFARVNLESPVSDAVERVGVASETALAERKGRAATRHAGAVVEGVRVAPDDLVVFVHQGEARVDGNLVAAAQVNAFRSAVRPDGVDALVRAASDAATVRTEAFADNKQVE